MNQYNCNYYAHIWNKECAHILISARNYELCAKLWIILMKLLNYIGISIHFTIRSFHGFFLIVYIVFL